MIRRLLCWLGIHYWQYLLAPPTWGRGDDYEPGLWCIFCNKRGPRDPRSGAPVSAGKRAPRPDGARVLEEAPCG